MNRSTTESPMKLLAIFGSPVPYTTPFLNALAKRLDLHVIYLSTEDQVSRFENTWGVDPEFDYSVYWKRSLHVPSLDLHTELSLGVSRRLSELEPDAILLVSWKPMGLEPLLWSRLSDRAAVMWSESTSFSGLLRGPASTLIRRWMTRAFDSFVTSGSQAARYLEEQLGVPPTRIVTSIVPGTAGPYPTTRGGRDSPDEVRFLFVGRLVARKRPLELIESFANVRDAVPNSTLTVVGGGELQSAVERAAARVPGVRYEGHREGAELDALYSTSDILVLPALREVWGVVVNEALSHGLFVIATDEVGSAYDLLEEQTGLVLPAHDVGRLAPSMIEVARTLDTSDEMRRRRASTIAGCTADQFATDVCRALDLAVRVRAGRRRRLRRIGPPT